MQLKVTKLFCTTALVFAFVDIAVLSGGSAEESIHYCKTVLLYKFYCNYQTALTVAFLKYNKNKKNIRYSLSNAHNTLQRHFECLPPGDPRIPCVSCQKLRGPGDRQLIHYDNRTSNSFANNIFTLHLLQELELIEVADAIRSNHLYIQYG